MAKETSIRVKSVLIMSCFGCAWIIVALICLGSLFREDINVQSTTFADTENDPHSSSTDREHTKEKWSADYFSRQRTKIFIDLGANIGDTLELFYQSRYSHALNDSTDFIAYAFEPNAANAPDLRAFAETHPAMPTHMIMKGASVRNETVLFWRDTAHNGLGSKIVAAPTDNVGKLCGFTRKWCDVIETVDVAQWLSDRSDCYIALKMDIEGHEYEVLEALDAADELCMIDELHIEWHHVKRRRRRRQSMIEALTECGLTLKYVTFPIDEVPLSTLRDSFSWSDMIFFDKFEDCAWNNTANGKSIRVTWCDEHYYKMLT